MTGNDALILVIIFCAPLAFGLCGALSIVALLFRGRVARIAQRLATVGLILVHAIILAVVSEEWGNIVFTRSIPFYQLTPVGHALVLAGYLRVRSRRSSQHSS
jgi:hypothetical protein